MEVVCVFDVGWVQGAGHGVTAMRISQPTDSRAGSCTKSLTGVLALELLQLVAMNQPERMNVADPRVLQVTEATEPTDGCGADRREPVTVVMCTFQGSRHVEKQLHSLLQQSWPVRLLLRDDASADNTTELARGLLRDRIDTLQVNVGNVGYVKNFEGGIRSALHVGAEYIALADQDDVWEKDRIATGMTALRRLERLHGRQVPLLVHADLSLIDDDGEPLYDSYRRFRRYRLGADKQLHLVLGENGVMGNTVLMNRALAELALPFPEELHVHDYWLALLTELFGQRCLIEDPLVRYRLHQNNASNTAVSLLTGWAVLFDRQAWRRWLTLDFKLPFKEDSRLRVLEQLLSQPERFPVIDSDEQATMTAFMAYLRFQQPRYRSLIYLLHSGVARAGCRYRLRLCLAVMLTRRYCRKIA